ncbi:MAG TPA: sigma-70 family RNA polymerase sigma factor [Labilithrix sp.]|nr:sigma-70 family RNA polymerase sigma factor [Labilithrix sp.]
MTDTWTADPGISPPDVAPSAPTCREVFDRELPFVYNALRRLGIRAADLPDATQEVFATVAAVLGDYDPARPLRPWVFGIAYRVGLRYLDVSHRRREVPSEIPEAPDSSPGADAIVERNEERDLARFALSKVEPSRRAVLILAHFEGLSVPEIASALQIPINTAYSRLHRARQEFSEAARKLGWRSP